MNLQDQSQTKVNFQIHRTSNLMVNFYSMEKVPTATEKLIQ